MNVADALSDATRRLREAGIDTARLDARVLLAHALGEGELAAARPESEVSPRVQEVFRSLVDRRARREPVAYITGHKEFWSLEFDVGPGVLVPRPESETLIEELTRLVPDRNTALALLDLGTGTGCLLLSALREYPRGEGTGVDASEEALRWARRNAAKLGVAGRCAMLLGNWSEKIDGPFDAILANPPYIRSEEIAALAPEVSRYEPVPALDGGPDGLAAYRAIAMKAASLLKPEGVLLAEIGAGQSESVTTIFEAAGLDVVKIARDLSGIPRCVVGRPRNREV